MTETEGRPSLAGKEKAREDVNVREPERGLDGREKERKTKVCPLQWSKNRQSGLSGWGLPSGGGIQAP